MSFWQPRASMVMMVPDSSNWSSKTGRAVISLDLLPVAT
jgi:hypothetical protein